MWLPRCLRPVGWMPEKMTMRTGEDTPPVRWVGRPRYAAAALRGASASRALSTCTS